MTKPITWTTFTGEKIRPKDMTSRHLHNTIAMVAINGSLSPASPLWLMLVKEARKRGLQYGFDNGVQRKAYSKPGEFYDLYKKAAGPMLKALGEVDG